jgi:hypothetical protein
MPSVLRGEARTPLVFGGQSVLHPALCVLRGQASVVRRRSRPLPRSCAWTGTQSKSSTSNTCVRSSSAPALRAQSDRHRRDRDPQRSYLSYRRERSNPSPPDLVLRPGRLGGEHGRVLPISPGKEDQKDPLGCDGDMASHRDLDPSQSPQAAILFDKFHVLRHLRKACDTIRKREYSRLQGKPPTFIKGQNTPSWLTRRISPAAPRRI